MNKSESIAEISKSLAKFQEEVKQPLKDKDNTFFKAKYVPLENVVQAISECGPKHGLSFVQWALNDDNGRVGVATMLLHTSGEFIEFDPVFMKADKETAQGAGSLISYLKRYSLSAVYGITSDVDDDGNNASGNQQVKRASDKQLDLVQKLIKGKVTDNYTADQCHNLLKQKIGTSNNIENFTSSEASAAIKILQGDKK